MRKILFPLTACLFSTIQLFAQSQGISYQAIIINKSVKEIPGVDVEGNYMPDQPLTVRFTILDEGDNINYQEDHSTSTDEYGMINLMIGMGIPTGLSPSVFTEIDWDGAPKNLRVEISLGESTSDFTEFSFQQLTFVPYAFHRNITATGDLTVGGSSTFNGEVEFQDITVEGTANMNGPFNVNNGSPANLSGELNVTGTSKLQQLIVENTTTMNNNLTVNSTTGLFGQVTIQASLPNNQSSKGSYPLLVQGSTQGIAVTVNGARSSANNFLSFWDNGGMRGRIEGQTTGEVALSFDFIWDNAIMGVEIGFIIAEAACTAAQLDACEAVLLGTQGAVKVAQLAEYNIDALNRAGVAYESTSGDYAEWLEKMNPSEQFSFGDIVGVTGGKISKTFTDPDTYMVISKSPIVLGNMPPRGKEVLYEKVAFMGQVPVKVRGQVNIGDYIISSTLGDGFGIGIHADQMQLDDFKRIVGVAWSESGAGPAIVNVAVGINSNDAVGKIRQQDEELTAVKNQLNDVVTYLKAKDPSFDAELFKIDVAKTDTAIRKKTGEIIQSNTASQTTLDVAFQELQRDPDFLRGVLANARKILDERGIDYTLYEQTRLLVTDEDYLIQVLKEFNRHTTDKK
jgi:hypothetical protein